MGRRKDVEKMSPWLKEERRREGEMDARMGMPWTVGWMTL